MTLSADQLPGIGETDCRPMVVMSYGMGVDSTAILLRWLIEPASRDFDLKDLVVVTAHTGDEFEQTLRDVDTGNSRNQIVRNRAFCVWQVGFSV